jgi:long-subunit acyl-CoA synthetase (AMP-forming)
MHRQQSSLTYAACAWCGIAAASLAVRFIKRQRNQARENRIATQGGLLPQANNVVHALEIRAASEALALKGADGREYSWKEYYEQVQSFARALASKSQGCGGGVAIHAFNCPEWFIGAIGALAAGWTVSGIYLTNTYEQATHILKTSGVKVLILEDVQLLETTYGNVLKEFPFLSVVLLKGGDADPHSRTPSWDSFCSFSEGGKDTVLAPPSQLPSGAIATLVYTSGTTGNPKAVELTHNNIHTVCAMMHARIPLNDGTVVVSYLPLSHIAAMGIDLFSPIYCGGQVHFADANALKGSLKDTLVRVRPTLFFGVPRVWEKMAAAMQAAAAKSYAKPGVGRVLKSIGSTAKAVGGAWWSPGTPEVARCLLTPPFGFFKLLAFRKVRKAAGLDRCHLLYTGAAPLSEDTLNYLKSLDMPLLEVFGMSESCGAIAVCGPHDGDRPLGACGRPLPMGELEIAPDGEILWKGDNNMKGYSGLPRETAATISSEGQLRTGDLGTIQKGFLCITGRKKDIIITAGGENVAPTPIEDAIKGLLGPEVEHVLLIGDRRKFLTILIAPKEGEWGGPHSITSDTVEEAIQTYNTTLAKSRAQRVQRAHVLEHPLGVVTGELTPTLKVKRAYVSRRFEEEIEAMYAGGASGLVGYSSMNIGLSPDDVSAV